MGLIKQGAASRGPAVLFSSSGPAPLKGWDVALPSTHNPIDPQALSPRESSSSIPQRISPVKVSLTSGNGPRVDKTYDEELRCFCFEVVGTQVSISAPPPSSNGKGRLPRNSLGISQSLLTLLVKNIGEPFNFEITLRDTQGISRRVRFSTLVTRLKNSQFAMCYPIYTKNGDFPLSSLGGDTCGVEFRVGWNAICLDLGRIMAEAFNQTFSEMSAICIHSNCRVKSIIAHDKSTGDHTRFYDQLGQAHWPSSAFELYKLVLPVTKKPKCVGDQSGAASPSSTAASSSVTRQVLNGNAHDDICAAASLFVIDPESTSSSSDGRRVRSFSAVPLTTSSSRSGRSPISPMRRIILSESSLAALDLAEPLPMFVSSMRPSSCYFDPSSPSSSEQGPTSPLQPTSTRDFRPSLPPLREEGDDVSPPAPKQHSVNPFAEDLPVDGPTHRHLFTPTVRLSDSPTTSSTSELDSSAGRKTPRRSLTTRLLHKAKLHVHHKLSIAASTTERFRRRKSSMCELGVNTQG